MDGSEFFDNLGIRSEVVWSKLRHLAGCRNTDIHFSPTELITFPICFSKHIEMVNFIMTANDINAFHTIMT